MLLEQRYLLRGSSTHVETKGIPGRFSGRETAAVPPPKKRRVEDALFRLGASLRHPLLVCVRCAAAPDEQGNPHASARHPFPFPEIKSEQNPQTVSLIKLIPAPFRFVFRSVTRELAARTEPPRV